MPVLINIKYFHILGWFILIIGVYFLFASNIALKQIGSGFAAFKLTKNIVSSSVYQLTRNPMSLGYYLVYIGGSIITGSTYLLVGSFVIILAHIFNLKYFEEKELLIRYGSSYKKYMSETPFIIPNFLRSKHT